MTDKPLLALGVQELSVVGVVGRYRV